MGGPMPLRSDPQFRLKPNRSFRCNFRGQFPGAMGSRSERLVSQDLEAGSAVPLLEGSDDAKAEVADLGQAATHESEAAGGRQRACRRHRRELKPGFPGIVTDLLQGQARNAPAVEFPAEENFLDVRKKNLQDPFLKPIFTTDQGPVEGA